MDAKERNKDMLRRVEAGETYASVARRHKVCVERVRQIVTKMRQQRELHESHKVYSMLGTRALNGLRNLDVDPTNLKQVSAVPKAYFASLYNMGKKAVKDVELYLLSEGVEWR